MARIDLGSFVEISKSCHDCYEKNSTKKQNKIDLVNKTLLAIGSDTELRKLCDSCDGQPCDDQQGFVHKKINERTAQFIDSVWTNVIFHPRIEI